MKKLLSICLACAMCFAMASVTVSAKETIEPDNSSVASEKTAIMPIDANFPTKYLNLAGSSYTATLIDLVANRGSYTLYYFTTSTGTISAKCNLERSGTTTNKNRTLRVSLYESSNGSTWTQSGTSKSVSFSGASVTSTVTFNSLNKSKFYCLYFFNASSTNPADSYDISGKIVVSQ